MPRYRVCKRFVVESGHMLSKHPEACRYPHGHTREVEIVVSSPELDAHQMVVDFKALKLAIQEIVEKFDHRMAINSNDPLRAEMERVYPGSTLVFEDMDPTTEAMAKHIYDHVAETLRQGFERGNYRIPPGVVQLDRVRVGETPTSWAEYGD